MKSKWGETNRQHFLFIVVYRLGRRFSKFACVVVTQLLQHNHFILWNAFKSIQIVFHLQQLARTIMDYFIQCEWKISGNHSCITKNEVNYIQVIFGSIVIESNRKSHLKLKWIELRSPPALVIPFELTWKFNASVQMCMVHFKLIWTTIVL